MALRQSLPSLRMDAVEIDSHILEVAREWFGAVEDDRLKLIHGDGLQFLLHQAGAKQVLPLHIGFYSFMVDDTSHTHRLEVKIRPWLRL